jgi:hypothetical protein
MMTQPISMEGSSQVQQAASIKTLKAALDFQQQAAMKLLDSLSKVEDPALGRYIDTYA